MATETKTFYPGAYDSSASSVYSMLTENNPVGKGSSNTTYAKFAFGTAFWSFDVSSVPLNADINSVSCKVKAYKTPSNNSSSGSVSLCSGSVEKGSAISLGTSATVHTLTGGTWTREELSSIRLKFVLAGTSSSRYIQFYGADLTVTYTYQSEKFMLKLGGAWHDAARVFKKVNGIWVEQEELANVVDQTKRLVNGGEYVDPRPVITFTMAGVTYEALEDMTWGEWLDSKYNTAGAVISRDQYVSFPGKGMVYLTDGEFVTIYETIQAGKKYKGG